MDELEIEYKKYLLEFMYLGMDDIIDCEVMSFEEFKAQHKGI